MPNEEIISDDVSNTSQHSIKGKRFGWFWILILFATSYGIIGGIGFISLDATNGYSLAISIPFVVASVMIIASWTVFGPVKFWVAFLLGQVIGVAIATACAIGLFVMFWGDFGELWVTSSLIVTFCFVPTVTVAAQIPLWIFRGFFGWRFTYRNETSTSSLSLRDLFFITFVFAIAVTAPQYASRLIAENSVDGIEIGSETYARTEVPQPDGSILIEQVTVTASNVEQLREVAREEALVLYYQVALSYGGSVTIISLLTVPWIWFVFRIRNPAISGVCCIAYALVFYVFLAVVFSVANEWAFFFYQFSFWTLVVITCSLAGFTIPLVVARNRGFRLTTARDRKAAV